MDIAAECRTTLFLDTATARGRVRFVSTASPADQLHLNEWCETVGPAVFRPSPAEARPRRAVTPALRGRPDSLVVVSWNVRVGGGDIPGFVRDLRAGRLTAGRPVVDFVLLLQEAYRAGNDIPGGVRIGVPDRIAPLPPSGRRIDIVHVAEELGLALLYVPSMRNGLSSTGPPFEDRGNAILSTLPLTGPSAIELPFERQRRVAISALVRDAVPQLRVVSAHLDNRSRFIRLPASMGIGRLRQAEALVAGVPRDHPLILGGDMNTWGPTWTEHTIPFMKRELPDSPPGTGQPTYIKPIWARRIDYLFADLPDRWRLHYTRVDSTYGSDHYPLLGWVVF